MLSTDNGNTNLTTPPPPGGQVDLNPAVAALSTMRLPSFWRHAPEQCVNSVVATLDENGINIVTDLLGPDAKYDLVKNRLIAAYVVPTATRFRSMVQPGGLGDHRPSQLLRDMRNGTADGISDKALKEFWLQKLPPAIRAVLICLDGDLDSVADFADRIMAATTGHDVASVSTYSDVDRFRAIENSILALTTQIAALTTAQARQHRTPRSAAQSTSYRSRSRSRSRPRNNNWCFYHNNFG
ncbi:uncharacterized protein LOC126553284 [Aphis gossypii]|uniref:uncharacterized protein LOC126553284 n=1 Tax=Aphis gossypii TaxID=80765 RepID=UPI002158C851|nr:uncharacterized protein LOC126553284 [Aphis gossypii]